MSLNQYVKNVMAGQPAQNQPKLSGASAIGAGIIAGTQPPTTTGLYKNSAAVRSYLATHDADGNPTNDPSKAFNLAQAQEDWTATQKYLATLNGPGQLRLRQAVTFASDSLGVIERLNTQWSQVAKDERGNFVPLNHVNLLLVKSGVYGNEAASVATQLDTQIADLTSELGTVYKGGNSSTDDSLSLAAKNLSADWSESVFKDMIGLVKTNLKYRQNSISNTGVAGTSENNPYSNSQSQPDESVVSEIISAGGEDNGDGTYTMPDDTIVTAN
jgi:hypothetical protein